METGLLLTSTCVIGFTKGSSNEVKLSEPMASDVREGANTIL